MAIMAFIRLWEGGQRDRQDQEGMASSASVAREMQLSVQPPK